jgi:monoamine oxidase
MARHPLFRELKHTLQLATRLEIDRIPTAEGLERRASAQARFTRRRFLQGAGLAAGALFVPRFSRPAHAADENIVIVGAGIAGLTCAYRLQQRGVQARIIEASTRVGGRMYSLRNAFPDGQKTELGAEFIDSDHHALRSLARELGLELVDLAYADTLSGNTFAFDGKIIKHDNHLIDAFRPLAAKVLEEGGEDGENFAVTYDFATAAGRALDNENLAEWLEKRGFKGLIAEVIKTAYVGEYGLEAEEQSALNLLAIIGTEPPPLEIYGDSDERFHVAQGNDAVAQELARRLEHDVELGTELVAIKEKSAGGYLLTVNRGGASDEISADRVVLALPFTVLRKVDLQVELPPVKKKAIAELGYGSNAKLICGFNKRPWLAGGATGSVFTDLGFQACWETSRAQPGSHGILTNFLGGKAGATLHQGRGEDHGARFVEQLDKVFPGAKAAYTGQAVRFTWPSHRHTLGSYTCYKPGQYQSICGAEAFAVEALHFCGEHTSSRYSGFMNGAVESGERVAAEILG